MKTIKYMMAAMAIAASLPVAYGQRAIETLQLTDGTILNGYTKEYYADGTRTFCAESAIYTIPVDSAEKVIFDEKTITIDALDENHLNFRRYNPELFNKFVLSDNPNATKIVRAKYAKDKNSNPTPVMITNMDSRDKKQFVVVTPQEIIVPAEDVAAILYFPDQSAKVGLYDVVIDKNGNKRVGFKIEENIDKDDVKLIADDITTYIKYDDITSVGYEPIDENTEILEQSPWIKEYKFENGESIRGVATVIDYTNGYIKIATPGSTNGSQTIITKKISDYKGYTTYRNKDAVTEPAAILDLTDDKLYINDKEVAPLTNIDIRNGKFTLKKEQVDKDFTIVSPTTRHKKVSVIIRNRDAGQAAILLVYPNPKGDIEIDNKFFDTTEDIYRTMTTGKDGETIYTFGEKLDPGKYILLMRGIGAYYPFAVE